MAAMTELKGSELGSTKVRVESGPVRAFATAVKDGAPQYREENAIVPPTFPFSWSYWGTIEGSTKGLPIDKLRGPGRMILHGEQEFVYHRTPRAGDVLDGVQTITDVYEKESESAHMTFVVMETQWSNASDGSPVVTERFNLIARLKR
jgi:hypothetical protein